MKKIIALLLGAVLLCGLCACGSDTRITSYDDSVAQPVVQTAEQTAETAETETAAETESAAVTTLDWDAAYAQHQPGDVVFTVDGEAVTWQELFYELANVTAGLQSASGSQITSWSSVLQDSAGNTTTCGDYVLSYALTVLMQYHSVHSHLTAAGVTLGAEGQAAVEEMKQSVIDTYFDGDKQAFLDNLSKLFCDEEMYDWFNGVDELYALGMEQLYGENGADLTDEEVLAYAEENGYVQLRQIYIYPEDTGDASGEAQSTEESTSEEKQADLSVLEPLTALLAAAVDNEAKEQVFDGLYEKYNENSALDIYGASRAMNTDDVSMGDVAESVYNAALSLTDYGFACVSADGAAVLIMRVPIQADAPVYYESTISQLCDLRYYAATQAYLDLINGEEGWLATADYSWVDGFEGFTLADAFAVSGETETQSAEAAASGEAAE